MKHHVSQPEQSLVYKRRNLFQNVFHSQKLAPYIFVSPFVISFLLFLLYPIVSAFIMSFQEIVPGETKFIGLKNYHDLWNDHFFTAIYNTTRYTFWTLLVLIPLPLILATLLNSTKMVGRNFFRSAMFMPALTSIIVGGAIFRLIFGQLEKAPMNSLLINLGLEPLQWSMGEHTGMFLMVVLASWRWMGVNILYFLSGLQVFRTNCMKRQKLTAPIA